MVQNFGVDPSLDPELAMALRVSLEEERARQEQANAAAGGAADTNGLVTSLGSLSLGTSAFDHIGNSQSGRPREAPGAIGSQRPGAGASRANPDRQPRGPDPSWEASGGFGVRGRANGHVQRGSGEQYHLFHEHCYGSVC